MTLDQLINAYKAVHDGIAPDEATQARLQYFVQLSQNQPADAAAMSYIVNSADNSTNLAVLSYQFFTGAAPTKAGLDYLVNSAANPNDLNDRYYSGFNLENRYINFAANLGVQGEGAAAFATKYGTLSFADYVASIYQTIIGSSYATAAGIDPTKAIADIVARKDAILATAAASGMVTSGMTAAQIDIALKAATAGYLLGEAVKADVGFYASAANNFMVAVATGTATYGTDITKTYVQPAGVTSGGGGQSVSPGFVFPTPVVTQPDKPNTTPTAVSHAFTLTTGVDTFTGESLADTFTGRIGTGATLNGTDVLNGAGGTDTLILDSDVASFGFNPARISNIEVLRVKAQTTALTMDLAGIGFTEVNNNGSSQNLTFDNAAPTSILSINNTTFGTTFITPNAGLSGSSDAITLKLEGVTSAAHVTITADVSRPNEYETLNIVSNGSGTNSITLATDVDQTSLATINISGSANLVLAYATGDHLRNYVSTIDAHALTGNLTVTIGLPYANYTGAAGDDTISWGVQGANEGSGWGAIATGTGNDVLRFTGNYTMGSGSDTSYASFAQITDFDVAHDKLAFSADDNDFGLYSNHGMSGAAHMGLSKGATDADLTAGDTLVVQSLAKDAVSALVTDVSFIKLTTAVAFHTDIKTTFTDAIGAGTITGLAVDGTYLVSVYDTTNQKMIVAVINTGANANGDSHFDANDLTTNSDISVVTVVGMSASDYATFGAAQLGLAF